MSILCGRYSRPWWRGFDVDFGIAEDAVAFWHSVGAAYAGCLPPSSQRTAGRGEGGHSHNDSTQKQNKKQEKNKKKNSVKGDQGRPTSGNVRRVGTSPVCPRKPCAAAISIYRQTRRAAPQRHAHLPVSRSGCHRGPRRRGRKPQWRTAWISRAAVSQAGAGVRSAAGCPVWGVGGSGTETQRAGVARPDRGQGLSPRALRIGRRRVEHVERARPVHATPRHARAGVRPETLGYGTLSVRGPGITTGRRGGRGRGARRCARGG
ncbi:hypothetical protein AcW1_003987 [Taiwanofungus camphoratus]|nr:hypothetical protein AcW1_003987 [Antrodia cinnamomea]